MKNNDSRIDFEKGENSRAYFIKSEKELKANTVASLDSAKIHIQMALQNEPLNIDYLLLYAKIKETSFYKMRDAFFDRNGAMAIYEAVLNIQPTNKTALYNLGRLKTEDYLEYNISVLKYDTNKVFTPANKMIQLKIGSTLSKEKYNEYLNTQGSYAINSYTEEAEKDYKSAETNLYKVLGDSTYGNQALTRILMLFYNKEYYAKGIQFYKMYLIDNSEAKEVHMMAGLIYESMSNHQAAYSEYLSTLKYMTSEEREDLNQNSLLAIIKEKPDSSSKGDNEKIVWIQKYWEINDPLLSTGFSERMLAHYARFAYAYIFLGSKRTGLVGWKSNRGEIVLRYGMPLKRERYHRNPTESPGPETEVWYYDNMTFSFSDPFLNGEYSFSSEYDSQLPINTYENIMKMRESDPVIYNPTFKGPLIKIPYSIYQFNSPNKKMTEVYISCQLNNHDTASSYTCGFYLLDSNFTKIYSRKTYYDAEDTIGTLKIEKPGMNTNMALELIRAKDNAVASYHGNYTIRNYNADTLSMSDIVLSSNIAADRRLSGSINRNGYSILPKPDSGFSSSDNIYLYYEVYNLKLGSDKLTNYAQLLTLRKIGDNSFIRKMMDVIGISKSGERITMQSNYQTLETTSSTYFQIDMSKYEAGEYELTITIKDKHANISKMKTTTLYLRR